MTQRVLALVGTVLMVTGLLVIVRADDGLVRERGVVSGVPVTTLRPDEPGPYPAVVVSHGFAASGRLMDGIGIALARDGWLAVLADHAGHGANHRPLSQETLGSEISALVDWVDDRGDVEAVTLLGHSMGAGAATRAAADLDLPVVALSLPSADELAADLNAVLAVGRLEPSRFRQAAADAADAGYPTVVIDGAEHISILFRTQTLQTAVTWLDGVVARPAGPVQPDPRMLGVGAAYLGSALLFWPVSALVVRRRPSSSPDRGARIPAWSAPPLAAAAAGTVLAVLPALGEALPLLVGDYLAALLALSGMAMLSVVRRVERPSLAAVPGLLMGLLAAVAVGVPAQLAWAEVSLSGARGWSALALAVAVGLFGWAELMLGGRYRAMVLGRLLLTAVVAVLAVIGAAPGFLTLLLPLMALLLPWFGAYGIRMRDLTGSALAGALAQAPPVALLVAVATPLG